MPMTVGDRDQVSVEQIETFLRAVDQTFPVPLSHKCDLSELAAKFHELATMCVEVREGRVVGMVAGYTDDLPADGLAYISVVATLPECRRQGIAYALVSEFLDVCRSKHIGACHLYADSSNHGAIAMYERLGFVRYELADEPRPADVHLVAYVDDLRELAEREHAERHQAGRQHAEHGGAGASDAGVGGAKEGVSPVTGAADAEDARSSQGAPEPLNILLTSAGRRSYLVRWFREALAGAGEVHAANSSPVSAALAEADKEVVSPLIYDEAYIPFLLDYCRANDIRAIVPLFDVDLPVLARNKGRFAEIGVTVVVADYRITQVCNDKVLTSKYLELNGIHVPATFLTVEEALAEVERGGVSFPLMVKPRWGMGSIAVYQADNAEELRVFFEKVRRDILGSYLRYESAVAMDACVIIQERLTGAEHGLDVMCDLEGSYVHTSVKRKVAMRSGETDCAVTVEDDRLVALGARLAALLHCPGNLDVDVFVTESGEPYVLELNARFGGGYPFSHLAGVDLPRAIVGWLRGEDVPNELLMERPGVMTQKDIALVTIGTGVEVPPVGGVREARDQADANGREGAGDQAGEVAR